MATNTRFHLADDDGFDIIPDCFFADCASESSSDDECDRLTPTHSASLLDGPTEDDIFFSDRSTKSPADQLDRRVVSVNQPALSTTSTAGADLESRSLVTVGPHSEKAAHVSFYCKALTQNEQVETVETAAVISLPELNCGCTSNCLSQFPIEQIEEFRLDCLDLCVKELDLVITAKLSALTIASSHTSSDKKIPRERKRTSTTYYHQGRKVCTTAFRILHGIGKERLANLGKFLRDDGLCVRQKKSGGRNSRAIRQESVLHVYTFLSNFAEQYAVSLPGRIRGYSDFNMKLLPSHMTKTSIHSKYEAATASTEFQCVRLSKFKQLWTSLLPYVVVSKPATDLCWTCQKNNSCILRSANEAPAEKTQRLNAQLEHLRLATDARDYYRTCRQRAQQGELTHLSFDFAQQVHYPSNPQQPGPIYFETPRKCAIFGICNEGANEQKFYLIDEAQVVRKGANSVISYLHHYLENAELDPVSQLVLHADNCCGQNKNNYLLWYLMWRLQRGLNQSIELNFMLAGHTKFSPDQHFGTFKKLFRRTFVSSLEEIAKVVTSSATNNSAIVLGDGSNGTTEVRMYDWATFLADYFTKVDQLLSYHQFTLLPDGTVSLCRFVNESPTVKSILKNQPDTAAMPETYSPSGLDAQRQWYLYEQIREFCKDSCKDVVCPRPAVLKPKSDTAAPLAPVPAASSAVLNPTSSAARGRGHGRGSRGRGRGASVGGKPSGKRKKTAVSSDEELETD